MPTHNLSGCLLVRPVPLFFSPTWTLRWGDVWEGHQADQGQGMGFLQRHPTGIGDVQPDDAVKLVVKSEGDSRQDKERLWVFFRERHKKSTNTTFRPEWKRRVFSQDGRFNGLLPLPQQTQRKESLRCFATIHRVLLVELAELSEPNFTIFLSRPRNAENAKIPETKVSQWFPTY